VKSKSIIFFIHRFNDIDHLTPIIYRIAKDTDYKILILSLSPYYDLYDDYRFKYLKENYKVTVNYIYKALYPSIFHQIFSYFYCRDTGKKLSTVLLILSNNSKWFNKLIFKTIYGEKWCKKLFNKYRPSVLVFDGTAAASKVYNVLALDSVSKDNSIPRISLPHGAPLFSKHPKSYDNAKRGLLKNDCNIVVLATNRWMKECIEFGIRLGKNHKVLGVARHCKEWENILQEIVPWDVDLDNKGKGKLKVVYMDMGPNRYEEFKSVVEETLNRINALGFVHLLFKPHTRSNRANLLIPENVENVKDLNSHNLIRWADVVIGMSSSIMLGVLMQNTVYVSPTYFRRIKMVYEEHNACWMVDSIDELEKALIKLHDAPSYRPYSQRSVDSFLTEIVYAGEKDKDVLGAYKDLIITSSIDKASP
jgi:hypothetical protein